MRTEPTEPLMIASKDSLLTLVPNDWVYLPPEFHGTTAWPRVVEPQIGPLRKFD